MVLLWTDFHKVLSFARNRAAALDQSIVIRRVDGGWVLPYYQADWNDIDEDAEEAQARDEHFRRLDEEYLEPGESDQATFGLSPMYGDTLMDAHIKFGEGWVEE